MKKQTVSKGLDAMDFGMAPGSRIKLSQSSTMKLRSRYDDFPVHKWLAHMTCIRSYVGDLQVTQSQSVPHSVDRLLVGTQTGGLFLQSRFDEPCFPNTFSTSLAKFTSMDSVHGVSFSPFLSTLFLVAYASGTVGLYSLQSRVALLSWQPSQKSSTLQVIWSTHRPAVFYALGQDGSVYVWDLIEREGDPVHTITSSEDPVRTMLSTPFESRDYNVSLNDGKVKNPRLILVHASGIILSHDLLETLGQPVIDELKEFSAYIDAKILKSVE